MKAGEGERAEGLSGEGDAGRRLREDGVGEREAVRAMTGEAAKRGARRAGRVDAGGSLESSSDSSALVAGMGFPGAAAFGDSDVPGRLMTAVPPWLFE